MILSAFGTFYANHQFNTKGVIWGRPLAGLLGILTLTLGIVKMVVIINSPAKLRENIVKKEQGYLESAAAFLGDYISTNHPGAKILLITGPETEQDKKQHKVIIELLEKGLAERSSIVATESPIFSSMEALTGNKAISAEEPIFTALSFDLMVERHPNCNLIVSLIGLPSDQNEMRLWFMDPEKRPKLIVVLGNPYELKNAIEAGYISAMITLNPKYISDLEKELPKNYKKRFFQRFLLINRENIGFVSKDNPGLFMRENGS